MALEREMSTPPIPSRSVAQSTLPTLPYRLSGTGIVEKNHRTIERMATRSVGESPLETDLTEPDAPTFYDRETATVCCHGDRLWVISFAWWMLSPRCLHSFFTTWTRLFLSLLLLTAKRTVHVHRYPMLSILCTRPLYIFRSAYNTRSPCWVTESFTVARRDTWDRSHASPTFLVDGPSVQPPSIASTCRRSNSPLLAAELFRLPLPPSGTRSLNTSSVHLYSTVISTSSENLPVPTFISGHSSVVNIF